MHLYVMSTDMNTLAQAPRSMNKPKYILKLNSVRYSSLVLFKHVLSY